MCECDLGCPNSPCSSYILFFYTHTHKTTQPTPTGAPPRNQASRQPNNPNSRMARASLLKIPMLTILILTTLICPVVSMEQFETLSFGPDNDRFKRNRGRHVRLHAFLFRPPCNSLYISCLAYSDMVLTFATCVRTNTHIHAWA